MNIIFGCIMSLIVMLTILVITAGIATRVEEGKITLRTPRKMVTIFILRFILYANVIYNFYTSIFWAAVCSNIKVSEAPLVEVLLSFIWIIFIILAWIFIACYFAHETGGVGLIPSYNEQKRKDKRFHIRFSRIFIFSILTMLPFLIMLSMLKIQKRLIQKNASILAFSILLRLCYSLRASKNLFLKNQTFRPPS